MYQGVWLPATHMQRRRARRAILPKDLLRKRRSIARVKTKEHFLHVGLGTYERHVDMLAGARGQQRVGIALRLQDVTLVQVLTLSARARLVVDDQASNLPPMPIHLPLLTSCSFFTRCSMR